MSRAGDRELAMMDLPQVKWCDCGEPFLLASCRVGPRLRIGMTKLVKAGEISFFAKCVHCAKPLGIIEVRAEPPKFPNGEVKL